MSAYPAGHILFGDEGRVHICIWDTRYQICPEDLGMLFFVGDRVPLMKKGPAPQVFQISGQVSLAPPGRQSSSRSTGSGTWYPAPGSLQSRSGKKYPVISTRCQKKFRTLKLSRRTRKVRLHDQPSRYAG